MSAIKWIWLSQRCGIASTDVLTLVSRLGKIDAIYSADFDTYVSLGIDERTADKLCDKNLDAAYSIISWCEKNKVGILPFDSEYFPQSLRALKDPPCVLYFRGKLPDFNSELCISVVGTRKMSEYGMKSAYKIAYEIAASGVVTVSGMALGIDGVAACASIAAKGRTVAVLGSGIDVIYPKEHKELYNRILERGAVITEYPPSTRPYGYNFPVRNRLISGLGTGTLVVDAPEGSGALITAKKAIIQGKDIYAVPGNISEENSTGTNGLIRDGATAVSCGRDVVGGYAFLYRKNVDLQKLARAESHSDFDPSQLMSMRVSTRIAVPAKEPIENHKIDYAQKQESTEGYEGFESFKEKLIKSARESAKKDTNTKAKTKQTKAKVTKEQNSSAVEPARESAQRSGDNSQKILESLSPRQREIFSEMPMDKPVTVDYFTKTGYAMGEVMSALTMLEIKGLISSLPGALYIRK